jgi:peptide/nickel transport system permease protein
MFRYIIRRVLTIIPVMLGVSLLVFGFLRLIPGDPAQVMLGERATPESIALVREQLGLSKPIYEQYLIFVGNALRGDLGHSVLRGEPVTQEIIRRFPATIELTLGAIIIAILVGIPAGIISAVRRGSLLDAASMLLALTGVSMPIFWLGLMLILLFSVVLHVLPTGARLDAGTDFTPITNLLLLDSLLKADFGLFIQALKHLALPAIALGSIPMAIIALFDAGSVEPGLHSHRASQRIERACGHHQSCAPQRVVASDYRRRSASRAVALRRDSHRDRLFVARHRSLAH